LSCRFTIVFDGRKPCDEDDVWIKLDFVSAVVENGTDGIICIASSSRSPVIGITTDVGDDDFVSLVDDADDGSSSPSICSLNVDDICGEVNSGFDFEGIFSYAKHSGHSFIICNHFPFLVRRWSWIEG
jgi:hypothetical protein